MTLRAAFRIASCFLVACAPCAAAKHSSQSCVSSAEAAQHLGPNQCVRGTVLRVKDGGRGVNFLDFCNEPGPCPFTIVVFPADRKKMGDMRQLEGQQIEIKGTIQNYDGRTEMILRRSQQLGESAFRLFPEVPTEYDVERQRHSSAGRISYPKQKKKEKKEAEPVPIEDPEQP